MRTFIVVVAAVVFVTILYPAALQQQNQIPNFNQNQIPNFNQNQIPQNYQQQFQRNYQQALDQLKNFGNEDFLTKSVNDLRLANTELNTNIKKVIEQNQAIAKDFRDAIKKSLKGLNDRFGELSFAEQKTACETMADNAITKGADTQDFEIRNKGCAKLGSSLNDLQIEQYATDKTIGRFTNANSIPAAMTQFTFGKSKISTQFLKELCGSQECSVMHQKLNPNNVSVEGKSVTEAQSITVMNSSGTGISMRSMNANSKVEITFDSACPKQCFVAPGDTSLFVEGDSICTMKEVQGKCVLTSSETSTYAIGDFSIRSFGYWFLGFVTTAFVVMI